MMIRLQRKNIVLVLSVALGACGRGEVGWHDPFAASGEMIALSGGGAGAQGACIACHGLQGQGNGAGVPRIVALGEGYLLKQLEDFAVGLRANTQMAKVARQLDQESRLAVSGYYAAMPMPTPKPDASVRRKEQTPVLYAEGDSARGIASCASCHGKSGEGVGTGNPALGRQPAIYLAEQLRQWRNSERRNDPQSVMLRISRALTPSEIKDLSAYASALPGAALNREFQATFRAARHPDPRNDVSVPPSHGGG